MNDYDPFSVEHWRASFVEDLRERLKNFEDRAEAETGEMALMWAAKASAMCKLLSELEGRAQ